MAIKEGFAYLLDPGLRKIFDEQTQALAARAVRPLLFDVNSSSKSVEYDLAIGGFSDFQEMEGSLNYDDIEQLWRTSYEHKQYVKGFKVERQLVDDDLYNEINKKPRALATAAMRTQEKHAASVFNNAFSTNGFDGVPLCDVSHPLSPSNAAVQGNHGTTSLSYDAVVDTRALMRAVTDDRGELISVVPNLLVVPAELEKTANEICSTFRGSNSQEPGTANYSANLVQDRGIRYIVWDYLTDANNWFLMDDMLGKEYLNWFDRIPLEFEMDPTSDFSLEGRWRAYMRYSYGWSNWKFVYGHEVA